MWGAAFGVSLEGGAEWYCFLHATQSPLDVWFMTVRFYVEPTPALRSLSHDQRLALADSSFLYKFDMRAEVTYIPWQKLPILGAPGIIVAEHLQCLPGFLLGRTPVLPLADWLATWPTPVRLAREPPSVTPAAPSVVSELERSPWAKMYTKAGAQAAGDADDDICDDVDAIVVEAAAALEAKSAMWTAPASDGQDFFVRFRSGTSWAAGGGGGGGVIATEAKRGLPREFCTVYKLRQPATFNFDKIGADVATEGSLEWCRRTQHYFDIWRLQGCHNYNFSVDELSSYVPLAAWPVLCAKVIPGSVAFDRVELVNAIRPINP